MEGERRFSRRKLQRTGKLLVNTFSFLFVLFTCILIIAGKAPRFDLDGWQLLKIAGGIIVAVLYWKLKWLLWLHEGVHISYACSHGIPCGHIGYIAETDQPGVGASLTFTNAPKKVWTRLTLAPLIIPASLIILGFFHPLIWGLALLIFLASFNDLVYVYYVNSAPGRFVTTTAEEIIVSQHLLSNASKRLSE